MGEGDGRLFAREEMSAITYDPEIIAQWKSEFVHLTVMAEFRPLPHRYQSNWRALHVDGFEDGKPIIFARSSQLQSLS